MTRPRRHAVDVWSDERPGMRWSPPRPEVTDMYIGLGTLLVIIILILLLT